MQPERDLTFWERAAETRWGRYMTGAERAALGRAQALAGEPGVSLEVGCEGGRWSRLLHDAGWAVVCTDVDAQALEVCRKRIPEARCIAVSPGDERLPCETAGVRLLLVYEVAPVIQSDWFPTEAARVLERGGVLVCTFYNPFSARGLAYRLACRFSRERQAKGSSYYTGPPYSRFSKNLQEVGLLPAYEEGLCWFPFTRQSDSPLIPLCTRLETLLGLRCLPRLSPFVLLVARRH